jgi:invasion protein IalB
MKSPLRILVVLSLFAMVIPANGLAEQLKFGDWVGLEETDLTTHQKTKKIGTHTKDGNSSMWLSDSDSDTVQLILISEKTIASGYYSYQIDRIDNLTIRSALKGCDSNCLTDDVPKKGELIQNMKSGMRLKLEYESYPDVTQKPTFSLRGFSRAYGWLITEANLN